MYMVWISGAVAIPTTGRHPLHECDIDVESNSTGICEGKKIRVDRSLLNEKIRNSERVEIFFFDLLADANDVLVVGGIDYVVFDNKQCGTRSP